MIIPPRPRAHNQKGFMTNTTLTDAFKILTRLRNILIAEFSFDGEDPKGLKTYQEDVDEAERVIEELRLRAAGFNTLQEWVDHEIKEAEKVEKYLGPVTYDKICSGELYNYMCPRCDNAKAIYYGRHSMICPVCNGAGGIVRETRKE